jgi:hypothetical protein
LRSVAITLGLGVCTIAQAQSTYTSPAKWNNFRPVSDKVLTAPQAVETAKAAAAPLAELPAPKADPMPMPTPEPLKASAPAAVDSAASQSSSYEQAASAPWQGSSDMACCGETRLPLSPWFGSANLLFLTLENGSGRYIASGLGSDFTTSLVDPDASTGFDISAGKYIDCGRYGLGMTYMLWNPGVESVIRTGPATSITASSPAYSGITYTSNANPNVYDDIQLRAAGVRATRDLSFQGIEANLFSFGLMGAQRASFKNCNSGSLLGGKFGRGLGFGNHCKGYGGATGPLVRACNGKLRVMTSHGFRWFQVEDDLEFAYNVDGGVGYQANDLYENVEVENNLYGYQFGGRLTYCLNRCLNLNIGGKFGIYGNHAEMSHRVGTLTETAYRNGVATDLIDTESSDTVLATLGELDLGLAYRLSCAWSIRGGYRLMGLTGVATAVDSLPNNYYSVASSGQVHADDSYVLHGGYVGLEFNW